MGTCAVAWRGDALTAVVLPTSERSAVDRIRRRHPEVLSAAPPHEVRRAITEMTAHLNGAPRDLRAVVVDLTGVPEFERRVYALTRAIPPGVTRTYGDVATALGDPSLARAVGQALGHNPLPLVIPCHRVLAAGGLLGGFSAPGGTETKRRLLALERAPAVSQIGLFEPA
jgi:methylated-DNA-[protein]-cysteine S-methyltransferase